MKSDLQNFTSKLSQFSSSDFCNANNIDRRDCECDLVSVDDFRNLRDERHRENDFDHHELNGCVRVCVQRICLFTVEVFFVAVWSMVLPHVQ